MPLRKELEELEHLVQHMARQNTKVSSASLGWHIDHSLKVIIVTCQSIKKSDPDDYQWRFNFSRLYVFTFGSFPRGRARAHKSVVADGNISEKDLHAQIQRAKSIVNELVELPKKSNFKHPYFGVLRLNQFVTFLQIHTNHHLKIIREIGVD